MKAFYVQNARSNLAHYTGYQLSKTSSFWRLPSRPLLTRQGFRPLTAQLVLQLWSDPNGDLPATQIPQSVLLFQHSGCEGVAFSGRTDQHWQ